MRKLWKKNITINISYFPLTTMVIIVFPTRLSMVIKFIHRLIFNPVRIHHTFPRKHKRYHKSLIKLFLRSYERCLDMKEYRYQMVCTRVTTQRFHLDNKENEIAVVHIPRTRRVTGQGVENNQAECASGRRMNYADSEICYMP